MQPKKRGISGLAQLCASAGIKHIVISPGSRSAPLVAAFTHHDAFECLAIPDERSAAFVALGIAQQTRKPVALICTSGTAALNYAPAVAEAYYQQIPLLLLTADRPTEWIDQGDGQTIRQQGLFGAHTRGSYQLPQEPENENAIWHLSRLVSEALIKCLNPVAGPVHINIPMAEPLYEFSSSEQERLRSFELAKQSNSLSEDQWKELSTHWNAADRKMILLGMHFPDQNLNGHLSALANDPSVIVLKETTSNIEDGLFVGCIDRTLAAIHDFSTFQPDLLITMGGAIVSKRIKEQLRNHKPAAHWHVSRDYVTQDTYQSLTLQVPLETKDFIAGLSARISLGTGDYNSHWQEASRMGKERHDLYLGDSPFSDIKVFDHLLSHVPVGWQMQLGNSTPIRYAQLFDPKQGVTYFSNRGTSGIDGCSSTAVGASMVSEQPVLMVTGDVSFFYDSNAFWNDYVSGKLKIVLINNGGGGIFRYLDGPQKTGQLEEFFETTHQLNAEGIARTFGLGYRSASSDTELKEEYQALLSNSEQCEILEIFTPRTENAELLQKYFDFIKEGELVPR